MFSFTFKPIFDSIQEQKRHGQGGMATKPIMDSRVGRSSQTSTPSDAEFNFRTYASSSSFGNLKGLTEGHLQTWSQPG